MSNHKRLRRRNFTQAQQARRRRFAYELLERRHLLAGTTTLWIDFDAAQGGSPPPGQISTSFASLYAPTSWAASSAAATGFLDIGGLSDGVARLAGDTDGDGTWDGDTLLSSADVQIAQEKITQTVESLFKNYALTVKTTASGWDVLQASQNDANNNTFVLFVANEFLQVGEVRTLGRSFQSPVGENNEWFGFVYAGNVAKQMAGESLLANQSPQDFVWNVSTSVAREFGRMLGLGNPGIVSNGSFVAAGQGSEFAVNDPLSSLMSAGGKSRGSVFSSIDYATLPASPLDIDVEVYTRSSTGTPIRNFAPGQNQHSELTASLATDSTVYRARGVSTGFTGESNNEFTADLLRQSYASPAYTLPATSLGTKGASTATSIVQDFVSGFNVYASTYVDDLANQLNFASTTLPLIDANLSQVMGLASSLPGLLPSLSSAGVTTLAQLRTYLIANGFTVDLAMTDAAFNALANTANADFIRARRSFTLLDVAGELGIRAGGLSGTQYLQSIGFTGNVDVLASIGFHVAVGIDTAGFYLIPGVAIEANASATGSTAATINAGLSASGSFGANLMPTVNLQATAADGRIRLSHLSNDFAAHTSARLNGRAGLDVSFQTNVAGDPVMVDGSWSWSLSNTGATLDTLNSGLSTRSLEQSLAELVYVGVKKLAAGGNTLTTLTNQVPWIGGSVSPQIAQSINELLNADVASMSLLDALAAKGFDINLAITPNQFLDALFTGIALPNDLLSVTYQASQSRSLSGTAAGAKRIAAMDLSLNGAITGNTNNQLNLSLGYDRSGGVYLVEGGSLVSSINATGNVTGAATVPSLVDVTATAGLSVSGLQASLTLTDGDATANERFYLKTTQGLNDALQTSIAWNGNVNLNNLKAKAKLPAFVGTSLPPLELNVASSFNMATGVGSFTSTPNAMLDGLAQWIFTGIGYLRSEAVAFTSMIADIPLIGESIASSMQTALASGFNFTLPATGVSGYLTDRGFTINAVVTAEQLFSGTLGSTPLLELAYTRTIQPAAFSKSVAGDLTFGAVALSLSGQVNIAPTLQYQGTFGLDLSNGPYIVEGASVSASIPLAANLTGFVSVGDLLRVNATANLNTTVSAMSRFSDFDSVENERFYLLHNPTKDAVSLQGLFTNPQSRPLTGVMNLNLALQVNNPAAKIPIVGQFLPTNFQWNAIVDYNLLTGEGNYQVIEDAAFNTAVGLLTNTEQTLMNSMLAEFDRRNPLPQSMRDLLTKPLPVLGLSPADIVGLPEEAKIVLNPLAYQNKPSDEIESGAPNEDRIDVRFDIASPANVINLLSGRDADLISLDIQQSITVDKTIPVVAAPLFSLFGVINFDVAVNIVASIGLSFDMVVGFDTKGFYIEESTSTDDYVVSLTGAIGGQLVGTGRLVILPFAEVSATLSLIATGGVLLDSKDGDSKLRVSEITDPDNISIGLGIDLGIAVDSTLGFPDLGLSSSFDVFDKTFELYRATGSAADIQGALSGVGDKILTEAKALALKAALGPIVLLQEVGTAVVDAIGDAAEVVGAFATETTQQIQAGLSNAADAATASLNHTAGVVSGLVSDAGKALENLGNKLLSGVGVDDAGSIFGSGSVEYPVTPPERRTYSHTIVGGVLRIQAIADHGFAAASAADLILAIAPDGRLIVDGPDFVRVEEIGYTKSSCHNGCNKDYFDGDYTHFNRLVISLSSITRIEVTGTLYDDRIIVDRSVLTTTYLFGLAGNDLLVGGRGNDRLDGGPGMDQLFGNDGADQLDGGVDNDVLFGGLGRDTLIGGDGDDSLDESQDTGTTGDVFYGGLGNDVIRTSKGPSIAYGGVGNDFLFGGSANDRLLGEDGEDYLEGGAGDDVLEGGAHADKLVGDDPAGNLTGNDTLRGGSGNDKLSAGKGNDFLYGDDGSDDLIGGEGNDLLVGGTSSTTESVGDLGDNLNGGVGIDTIYGGRGDDLISGGSENDTLYGGTGNDTIDGGSGTNTLYGDAGNDKLNGLAGNDTLYGGDGDDLIIGKNVFGGLGNDTIVGTQGNDILRGDGGDDKVSGLNGTDQLLGGTGNDTLSGGQGDDTLSGELGNDVYLFVSSAALGSDTLRDTGGIDTISFEGSGFDVTFSLATAARQTINPELTVSLSTGVFENVIGGDGNDRFTGNLGNNVFTGGPGNDTFNFNTSSPQGSDQINDAAGTDTISFQGSSQAVTFNLGLATTQTVNANLALRLAADNIIENLIGSVGNDNLIGNSLNNRLVGAAGNDTLDGRTGDDTYVFAATANLGADTITDSAGIDTLDFFGSSVGIQLNLASSTLQTINSFVQVTLTGPVSLENVLGTDFSDTIIANAFNNRLEGFAGDDRYLITATGTVGSDTIVDSSGIDTLDYSQSLDGLQINLASNSLQTVTSAHSLTISNVGLIENLFGGAGNDTLSGNTANNILVGAGGNDLLSGGAGNDTYVFDTDTQLGADRLEELSGDDTLDFSASSAGNVISLLPITEQIVNSNLRLTLNSAVGFENILGGSGNDTLTGNTLNNLLRGDGGDDLYLMPMATPRGSDRIEDSAGIDTFDFSQNSLAVTIDLSSTAAQAVSPNLTLTLASGASIDNVLGGSGNDALTGNSLNNRLVGAAGNDTYHFAANSPLGDDFIADSAGLDSIDFSLSTVGVAFSLASTTLQTTNEFHRLQLESATSIETLKGGAGDDSLTGNSLNNTLNGGLGNDTYHFTSQLSLGVDTIEDISGSDTVNFITTTVPITLDLAMTATQIITSTHRLTLVNASSIENAYGGAGNDRITGNAKANVIAGAGGNDILRGLDGDDSLDGDDGDDELYGDLGNDVLRGGDGNDLLDGAAGNDRLDGGNGTDDLRGGSDNDVLNGDAGPDKLTGSTGNDSMNGGADDDIYYFPATVGLGNDTISETSGVDLIDFTQTLIPVAINLGITTPQVVNDRLTLTLNGDADIENVIGGAQNDLLIGNRLNNVIEGAAGSDTMRGLEGSDTYVFRTAVGAESDVVDELLTSLLTYTERPVDVLDFTSLASSDPVNVNLNLGNAVFAQHLRRTIRSVSPTARVEIEEVRGGAGGDTFTTNSAWHDSLKLLGNGGDDRFNLSWNLGGEAITALGGAGNDTVAFTGDNVNDYVFAEIESFDLSALRSGDFNAADEARRGIVSGGPFTIKHANGLVVQHATGWTTERSLNHSGDTDSYRFTLTQPTRLLIDPRTSVTPNASLTWTLAGSNGDQIRSAVFNDYEFALTQWLPAGVYEFQVEGEKHTGAYDFRIYDLDAAATLIAYDQVVEATRSPSNSTQLFQFVGQANESIYIDQLLSGPLSFTDEWTLFDPYGNIITNDYSHDDLGRIELKATGKYTLVLWGYDTKVTPVNVGFAVKKLTDLANTLVLNTPISSTITKPGEIDRYTFTLTQPTRLFFDGQIDDDQLQARIIRDDEDTAAISSFSGLNDFFVDLKPAGTYTIEISRSGDATGNYQFALMDFAAATAINVNTTQSFTLTPNGGSKAYKFNASAASIVFIDRIGSQTSSLGHYWELYDPFGKVVAQDWLYNDLGRIEIANAGIYTLVLRDEQHQTSPAVGQFRVRTVIDQTTNLTLGTPLNGSLSLVGRHNFHPFSLSAPTRLNFAISGTPSGVTMLTKLVGPDGIVINEIYTDGFVTETLFPGDYYFELYDSGDRTYNYTLNASNIGLPPTGIESTTPGLLISVGSPISAAMNQERRYKFTLASPTLLAFDALKAADQFAFELISPSGVVQQYRGYEETRSLGYFAPGTYQLRIIPDSLSATTFRFALLDFAAATTITAGVNVNVALPTTTETKIYRYLANQGDQVFIDTLGFTSPNSGFDVYVTMLNPYGTVLKSQPASDDLGRVKFESSGFHYFMVSGQGYDPASASSLQFKVVPVVDLVRSLALNTHTTVTLAQGQHSVYNFTLTAPKALWLDARMSGDDVQWEMTGPANFNQSGSINSGDRNLGWLQAGTYQFRISESFSAPATASFAIVDAVGATAINLDQAFNVNLLAERSAFYKFTAVADQTLFLDDLNDSITYFHVLNPYGVEIASSFGDSRFIAPVSGSYTLVVQDYNDDGGMASFRVSTIADSNLVAAIGSTQSQSIVKPGQIHNFDFALTQASLVYLDLISTLVGDLAWKLDSLSDSLDQQASFFSDDRMLGYLPAGTHRLSFQSNSDEVGAFSFAIRLLESGLPLTLDSPTPFTIQPAEPAKIYRFMGQSLQTIFIDPQVDDSNFNLVWSLRDPLGIEISSGFGSQTMKVRLPMDGAYTLILGGYVELDASFTSTLLVTNTIDRVLPLSLNANISNAIALPGQKHDYRFSLSQPTSLWFDSLSSSSEFRWSLSGGGRALDGRFDFGDRYLDILPAGEYTLSVTADSRIVGPYGFRLLDQTTATTIAVGSPALPTGPVVSATLADPNSTRLYRFNGTAGHVLRLRDLTTGSSGFAYFTLVSPLGNLLFRDASTTADWTLPQTGTYTLQLSGENTTEPLAAMTRSFRLDYLRSGAGFVPSATTIALNQTVSAFVPASGSLKYTLTLATRTFVVLDIFNETAASTWKIQAADGTERWQRSFSYGDSIGVLDAGVYQLVIEGNGASERVQFRVLTAATSLNLNTETIAILSPSTSMQLYRFAGNQSATYYFESVAITANEGHRATWEVIDPFGASVKSGNFNESYRFTLPHTGEYRLIVHGQVVQTAAIRATFKLQTVDAGTAPVIQNLVATQAYNASTRSASLLPTAVLESRTQQRFAGAVIDLRIALNGTATDRLRLLSSTSNAAWSVSTLIDDTASQSGRIFIVMPILGVLRKVHVGQFSGGIGTNSLRIELNANATTEAVQTLLRSLQYFSTSTTPGSSPRQVALSITDGKGSSLVTPNIQVTF